jgi:hypothetical protein
LTIGSTINGYPDGGTFPVVVTTIPTTGCSWTAVSNATWIHVTEGASGSGSGTFTFAIDANTTGAARTGTVTAAGRLVTVNQSAKAGPPVPAPECAATITIGSTINGYPNGGTFDVGVDAAPGCSWTASSQTSWIHMPADASGTGIGQVAFTVDPNKDGARTGTLTIAGNAVTFHQSGK